MTTYHIGHSLHRLLSPRAASNEEQAALDRLAEFRGSELDLRVAAALHLRRGEREQAGELLRMVPPERREG